MREWESWAEVVGSRTSLPPTFRDFVPDEASFPYTVYAPAQRHGSQSENSKLVCLYPSSVTVLEDVGKGAVVRANYPFPSIERVIAGHILLSSWLELRATTASGLEVSTIMYDSVVSQVFEPIILAIRRYFNNSTPSLSDKYFTHRTFDFLHDANLKFSRYAPNEVLPGSPVAQILYQSELQSKLFHIFRRILIPNRIIILTDKELITVSDATWAKSGANARFTYGVVKSFIALKDVRDATIADASQPGLVELSIALPHEEIRLPFEVRLKEELETLRDALRDTARAGPAEALLLPH